MIHVAIHPSQFPEQVRADLLGSLRSREIRHKFLYDTYKQAQKWLVVHEAHSPVRKHAEYRAIYDEAFAWIAERFPNKNLHVIGLGCGGGQKDVALLEALKAVGSTTTYSAIDVSLPLVITARLRALPFANATTGLICDLEKADDIAAALGERDRPGRHFGRLAKNSRRGQRVLTFFGLIPNCEPDVILPRVRELMRNGDLLLISANLAPGVDYHQGVKRVLPQYDNAETADWLLTFLYDLGVEPAEGELKFSIQECSSGLLRIRADFHFTRERAVKLGSETIPFARGESVRLFYSYRYTPPLFKRVLSENRLIVNEEWLTDEEALFVVTCHK